MSTFNLLRLNAEIRRDGFFTSFASVIITGWSSYLTSGREVDFTLLDSVDSLSWTLTTENAANSGEVQLNIPASSLDHALEVTARLLYPVDSCTAGKHWEVVQKASCVAVETPRPTLDELSNSYANLSLLNTPFERAIRAGWLHLQVKWKRTPASLRKAIVLIDLDNPAHPPIPAHWRITVAEEEENDPASVTEHVFLVLKEQGPGQQRFEVPSNILESPVRYRITVEGLIDDTIGVSNGNCGSFRIAIQRTSYAQATLTVYNNLFSHASQENGFSVSITKLIRLPWVTLNAPQSWNLTQSSGLSPQTFEFPLRFTPGSVYEVTVSGQSYKRTAHFRAELTPSDIGQLHEMALRYNCYNGTECSTLCRWIYRNKTPQYFDSIRRSDGIMRVYDKNSGGDPGCPINHRIKGLFFTATVDRDSTSGKPIRKSPFGTSRLLVPVAELLEKAPKLYFADFCCKGRPHHYVTLVMTRADSEADRFCADHLLSLSINDKKSNPFFFFDADLRQYRVTRRQYFLVELFFTEDLDIRPYEVVENVPTFGLGTSLPEGVPKNRSCDLCNLRSGGRFTVFQ